MTNDIEGAQAFYPAVFGWGVSRNPPAPAPVAVRRVEGGRPLGGRHAPEASTIPAEVPPFWGVYFAVDDADQAVDDVIRLGGQMVMPATDIEPGRFAVVSDPDGAMFNVMALREGLA